MSTLAHRTPVEAHPVPEDDPVYLELEPTPGPRPDSVRAHGGPCQVIELYPQRTAQAAGEVRLLERNLTPVLPRRASCSDVPDTPRAGGWRARLRPSLVRRRLLVRLQLLRLWLDGRACGQQGMATAEYAIATLGAVAFAGLLVVIMRSDEVRGFLLGIIRQALALP